MSPETISFETCFMRVLPLFERSCCRTERRPHLADIRHNALRTNLNAGYVLADSEFNVSHLT